MTNAPKFVIGLEPTQAVEFLKQKKLFVDKIKQGQRYESALARATTVARLTNLDMLRDIYQSIEQAVKDGKAFHAWKKDIVNEFERKGWVFGHDKAISRGIDGTLLADPKTGEYFGTPRRLDTIYRTNTQAAFSAGRYQRMMDNVDNRPYWQYSAVGDERTRPSHLALNGRIYRYDDPFWATFYPPNGFNCRCTVIALNDRDLKRKGLDAPDDSSEFLVEVNRPMDKQGNQEKTIGFKLPDGSVRITDKGFDYNVGRLSYKPNLDLYPEKLAHQFAKSEMRGGEFKHVYGLLEKQVGALKNDLGNKKLTTEQMVGVRNHLERNFKFAAGRLSETDQKLIGTKTATVWLSDDTLIKQFNSREGQRFGLEDYAVLPEVISSSTHLFLNENKIYFFKVIDGKVYISIVKHVEQYNELFVDSFYVSDMNKLKSFTKKYQQIK
ncbi:phage minor head protein [Caviibacterium pharyngocola]|uniref:Phage head morphogenesis protein n=1 Tax=Caviibacterium pharyngocola TaxID=28159 RepID=A0A2M8RY20_9PAST|nr:phage minor head protein [Caviibacterium pharyngocola]PJG83776.1 phage head morphogenesis protein [Caviibacterium pharyngocola]